MKKWKDFNITPQHQAFVGDKIKMSKILNRKISVLDYKIVDSNYSDKGSGKCLHLQISLADNKHVVFTGSKTLIEQIQQVSKNDLPFETTIIENNERYEFN